MFIAVGLARCHTRPPDLRFFIYEDILTGDEVCASCGVVCSNFVYEIYWGQRSR